MFVSRRKKTLYIEIIDYHFQLSITTTSKEFCLLFVDWYNWLLVGVIDYHDPGNAKQRVFDWNNQLQDLVIDYSGFII